MFALAGLLLLASALSFAQPARAAVTVSMTAPASVTQGSNIPISVSFTVGTGDSGTFYFTCDQTSSGEVSPESGYSISASTSKTYTFTPSQAQTYTNCKVSDGGTQSSSAATITAIAPTTLTVAGSPSSSTSASFTLGINITNPTASSVTTSYALSGCSTVGSCSGDQTSATITIGSGSATSLSWTVTATSSGTLAFQLGSNSNAFSTTVTITSATTTTTTPAGASSSVASTDLNKVVKLFSSIVPGVTKAISEADLLSSSTKLTGVQFEVVQRIVAVEMTVESLASKPSSVSADAAAKVYKYFSLSFTNLAENNTESAKITFKVAKDWLSTNGVSASSVALYRYAGGAWVKLVTTKTSEDTGYAYYEATTPGFSYFAIGSSQAASATTTTAAPSGQPATTTTAPSGTTTTVPGAGAQLTDYSIIIAVIVLVLIVAVVLVAAKLGYVDLDGLFDWLRGLFGRPGWQRRKSWRDLYSEHR